MIMVLFRVFLGSTWSMICTMGTSPFCAARWRGVEPFGTLWGDGISISTVRTINEAPASNKSFTHLRWPLAAAMCRAVKPFSARLSMYLQRARTIIRNCGCFYMVLHVFIHPETDTSSGKLYRGCFSAVLSQTMVDRPVLLSCLWSWVAATSSWCKIKKCNLRRNPFSHHSWQQHCWYCSLEGIGIL